MSSLVDFTDEKFFKRLKSRNKYKAIEELAMVFRDTDVCSDMEDLVSALKEREEIMSTGIGFGLAIPHAKIKAVREIAFAIGISKKGIDFNSIDEKPVHLIVLVAAGEKQHTQYLKLLSKVMAILKDQEIKDRIIKSGSVQEIMNIFRENEET